MPTSAEQLHHGKLDLQAGAGPEVRAPGAGPRPAGQEVRLFIDLDACASGACRQCEIRCSYFYHPGNNGIVSVVELATYALVCRRCEEPHCVSACPFQALEQQKDKDQILVRHNMRCVGCRSCSHACPYGTVYPELVPLLAHNCDFCLDRRNRAQEPLCIASCPYGALALRKVEGELAENTFLVGENLMVHSTHWMREKA